LCVFNLGMELNSENFYFNTPNYSTLQTSKRDACPAPGTQGR
jgi:hypothetical protein